MGRAPCCEKVGLRRGRWTREEDEMLTRYIQAHGEGSWRSLPKNAGLLRCGKSCRLRWINYLRADLKRGNITPEEHQLILQLHSSLGNRWSLIAGHLPGRTDNEIKNYWNSHVSKRNLGLTKTTATSSTERDQPPPAATMVGADNTASATVNANGKRKGKTSRFCMKKNALKSSSLKKSNNSTCPGRDGMDNVQQSPTTSLLGIKDKVESTGIHFSRVDDVDEGDKLLGLGPDEWLDSEMMRLEEYLLQDKGIDLDMGLEGFKHGKPTETEKDVVTASYGESNSEWYGNNNSSSSSVNNWFDWEWMMRKDEEASDNNSAKGSQFMFM